MLLVRNNITTTAAQSDNACNFPRPPTKLPDFSRMLQVSGNPVI